MKITIPSKDEKVKGGVKRKYWTRDAAIAKRRALRVKMESELASKGKNWSKADRQACLNDRWGEYCSSQRDEGEARG